MKKIKVALDGRSYEIVIGNNCLPYLGVFLKKCGCGDNCAVITNPGIKKIWGKKLAAILKRSGINPAFEVIADTEKSKSIKTSLELLDRIASLGRSREVFIIAFGGGVVGDVAGFIASIYKRGVPYVQIPTTLLAQVDSAIGGKTAIDLKAGKNLAGSFYQPRLVFSETKFLKTLPDRQFVSGLAEAIKCAVIKDAALFKFLEDNLSAVLALEKSPLERVISASAKIKARTVELDELDRSGIRALLNYGHTIGHAIENAAGYSKRYTHGEAISIGMAAANLISERMGMIPRAAATRIEALLKKTGLPVRARAVSAGKIYDAHLYDKKFVKGKNRFVLPVRVGEARVVEGVPEGLVKKAINSICGKE
ncbi:MAG: 3-dehydroquinate synthase [Candidatus Omnitrophica bacterium]|nr:3-dehydroquinate synthase [Candidatus Omnitrophota bacterium]